MRNFFKRKPNELEERLLDFIKGDGIKIFAEEQSRTNQEHYWRLKEIERKDRIKEKYGYLKYRTENGLKLSNDQQKEYEFVKYICEKDER